MLADNLRLMESLAADRLAGNMNALRTALQISEKGPVRAPTKPCHSCQAASDRVSAQSPTPVTRTLLSRMSAVQRGSCHLSAPPAYLAIERH